MLTPEEFNERGAGYLPGYLGVLIIRVEAGEVRSEIAIGREHMAPNGFLHAGTVVTLADTSCGYGCVTCLPEGATGFTTIELKSNYLGTARQGVLECVATSVHLGRTTQVWDAVVKHRESSKTIAVFRCTQMVLYAKSAA